MNASAYREQPAIVRWLGRTVLIGSIELLTIVAVASALEGVHLADFGSALQFVVFVGFANALLWPLLARLTLPFLVLSFGFLSLALNGLTFWIGSQLVAGAHFDNYFHAFLTALIVALMNVTASSWLTIDEDASFYRAVLQRTMRRMPLRHPLKRTPGVLFLEIDGLSEPVLRQAIAGGYMPTLERMLTSGTHRLTTWETDLSSQTGAAQAGILHGNNFNIPAFRWVEKQAGARIITANHPRDANAIERRISDGHGLLHRHGRSRANLFSGDAEDAVLTYSLAMDVRGIFASSYFAFFSNPYNFVRTLTLMVVDMVRELRGRRRQLREGVLPRLPERRRGLYPLLRSASTVLLRDITVDTLISDVLWGEADVIYATFAAYDEVAHHAGVADRDALQVLRQLDRAFARIERAIAEGDRPYQIVVLSDHGQTQGATFKQRYGLTLKDLIERLLPEELRIHERLQTNEDWGHVAALITDVVYQEEPTMLGRLVQTATRKRVEEGHITVGPEFERLREERGGRRVSAKDAQVIVMASGNLGLVYFTGWLHRLTLEEIESYFPGLVDGLVQHPGIGFLLVHSERHGPLALGARGVYYLAHDRVVGENPLASFSANAPMLLRRVARYDNAPDLLINSFYDPVADEGCAFEELIGFHGGLGGSQNRPFLLAPEDWGLHDETIVGAEQLHRLLKRRVEALASQEVPVEQQKGGPSIIYPTPATVHFESV
uniref:Phage holin family protein n=1 Tax=Caldilinea aerophila TaxID=133453 RepID=A0A7C1FUF0_9CHLR